MGKYTLAWNDEVSVDTMTGCALFALLAVVGAFFTMMGVLCPGTSCTASATCMVGAIVLGLIAAFVVGAIVFLGLCALAGLCIVKLPEPKPKVK